METAQLLLTAISLAFAQLIWFNTNALYEYFLLLTPWTAPDYERLRRDGYEGNLVDYVAEYYRDFFLARLITCNICVATWSGLVVGFGSGANLKEGLALAFLSLLSLKCVQRLL